MTLTATVQTDRKQGVWRTSVSSRPMSAATQTAAVPPAEWSLASPDNVTDSEAGLEMLG